MNNARWFGSSSELWLENYSLEAGKMMVTLTSLTVLSHWARDVDLSVESLQKECASTKLVVLKNIGKQNSHHIIQGEVQESLKQ